jgi:hypothetical protein
MAARSTFSRCGAALRATPPRMAERSGSSAKNAYRKQLRRVARGSNIARTMNKKVRCAE